MPIKTALTVLTFIGLILLPEVAPALKNYKSLDPHNIPAVLDFPVKKQPGDAQTVPVPIEQLRAQRAEASAALTPASVTRRNLPALLRS
jgi:hypothetical protein